MFSFRLFVLCCLLTLAFSAGAQDSTRLGQELGKSEKLIASTAKKLSTTGVALDKSTNRYLDKLQRQEEKLKRKLWKKDTTQAKQLFGDVKARYQALKATSGKVGKYAQNYSGRLDSLATSFDFLKQSGLGDPKQLTQSLDQIKGLQEKLNATEQIRKQIQARQTQIQQAFSKMGWVKQLKNYQKTAYYYQAQLTEYKALLNQPDQLVQKLLGMVQQLPQFKEFFAKNSLLGQLFPQPDAGSGVSIAGLQTRASVNQLLTQRFGSPQQAQAAMGQGIQSGQSQLAALRNRAQSLSQGSLGSGNDPQMPSFQPNNQKAKSFLNRLEYGFNAQSQKAKWMFPTTTDLAAQLGYKLNDKSVVGIGVSYKIGWGKGWNQIAITHQGVGLRTYLDWKLKGSFYLSGGYEQNYRSAFKTIDALKDRSAWQASGLIGVSKKYHISSKIKGEFKLLWDFLSDRQVPKTQAILFRIGYNFK